MTFETRKLKQEEGLLLGKIATYSFPGGGNTIEGVSKWIEETIVSENPDDVFYGTFKDGKLVGGSRYLESFRTANPRRRLGCRMCRFVAQKREDFKSDGRSIC